MKWPALFTGFSINHCSAQLRGWLFRVCYSLKSGLEAPLTNLSGAGTGSDHLTLGVFLREHLYRILSCESCCNSLCAGIEFFL